MNLRNRPVRLAAAVGAVLAAGTTTFLALVAGTASADEPGRCTQNVNVREDAEASSKIIAMCQAGKQVTVTDERDGFVRLDELGGWASMDYVKADDDTATEQSTDADRPADDMSDSSGDAASGDGADQAAGHDAQNADDSHGDDAHGDAHGDDSGNTPARPLAGLLG